MGNVSRWVKAHNKEPKGKAGNQKYKYKHESISSLERINKLKHMSLENPKTEMQKEKQVTKNK